LKFYLDGVENFDVERAKQLLAMIEDIIDPKELLRNAGELGKPTFTQSNNHSRGNVYLMDEWRVTSD